MKINKDLWTHGDSGMAEPVKGLRRNRILVHPIQES